MRVIITGAAGGIGSYIIRRIQGEFDVVGFDAIEGPPVANVEWVIGDILDVDKLTEAARNCDVMVHLAGIPIYNPEQELDIGRVNMYGMQCAIEAAVRAGVGRFVYASSICATSFINWPSPRVPRYFPIDEQYMDIPDDVYGLSKFVNEYVAKAYESRYGLQTTGLRLATVWLPEHEPTNAWLAQLLQPESDDDLKYRDLRWQYVDVRDAAEAFYLSIKHPTGLGVCNVGAANTPGSDWSLWLRLLYPETPQLLYPAEYVADLSLPLWSIRKFAEATGYEPQHSWEEYAVFTEQLASFKSRIKFD